MNKLNVLYGDNHIIVALKKPNILSQSDITKDTDMLSLVKEYVKEKYSEVNTPRLPKIIKDKNEGRAAKKRFKAVDPINLFDFNFSVAREKAVTRIIQQIEERIVPSKNE